MTRRGKAAELKYCTFNLFYVLLAETLDVGVVARAPHVGNFPPVAPGDGFFQSFLPVTSLAE